MPTKRRAGVSVFAVLFLIWGIRALAAVPPGPGHSNLDRILGMILAALSFATAYGLFQMHFWSLKVYAVLVALVIAVGSVFEYQCGTWIITIVVGEGLLAAGGVAVGLYLRSSLKESG